MVRIVPANRSSLPACRYPLRRTAHAQRGVVAIEFALVFLFGLLPLLLLTLSGVLIFAAKQSLTLAAAEGARAALRYDMRPNGSRINACNAARNSMKWLLAFSGNSTSCTASGIGSLITVTAEGPCPSTPTVSCMTVTTSFDYKTHPFIPGTATVYSWVLNGAINSSATVQLDNGIQGS